MILSQISISIHAPREGSDPSSELKRIRKLLYFNPRSPRGERPPDSIGQRRGQCISIHAPREGSDRQHHLCQLLFLYFNPRSPRGERPSATDWAFCDNIFQSTLPARGATCRWRSLSAVYSFQSTLPARGATRTVLAAGESHKFQSTLPARGATSFRRSFRHLIPHFNPRSPRGERPRASGCTLPAIAHFNPRSPRGERRTSPLSSRRVKSFQSTLPARGATILTATNIVNPPISIHAPREGSDIIISNDAG